MCKISINFELLSNVGYVVVGQSLTSALFITNSFCLNGSRIINYTNNSIENIISNN